MIKVLFIKTTFIGCCILISQSLNATTNINLTMDQAVKISYKNRPSLKAKTFSVQASKHTQKKALSGNFPKVSITDTPFFTNGKKGLQNNIAINASQLIYSFAGPLEEYKIAKKGTQATEYDKLTHKDKVRYEVESSFLKSWFVQKKNEFMETLNTAAIKSFKKAAHKNELNLLNKTDWLQENANYSKRLSTVYIYNDELKNARNELEFFMGKPFGKSIETVKLEWNPENNVSLEKLSHYQNLALKNRTEIKQKQKEVEQQAEYKKLYKNKYLPTLNVTGNVGRAQDLSIEQGHASSYVGFSLNWDILDGGANFHESNKANANRLKALMEKNHYIQQVKYEVEKAYNEFDQYHKQLTAMDIQLAQAKNEFELKKLRYDIGDLSCVEMEIATHDWETQKLAWIEIKTNLDIKHKELHFICGYPKDWI